jgi:hypothetical protein
MYLSLLLVLIDEDLGYQKFDLETIHKYGQSLYSKGGVDVSHVMNSVLEGGLSVWFEVRLDNTVLAYLVKKLPAFNGTLWFIIVFKRCCHWTPSWAILLQSVLSLPVFLIPILIFYYLLLGLSCGLFPSGFSTNIFYTFSISHT